MSSFEITVLVWLCVLTISTAAPWLIFGAYVRAVANSKGSCEVCSGSLFVVDTTTNPVGAKPCPVCNAKLFLAASEEERTTNLFAKALKR
jgi:hypothetical protein